MSIPVFVRGFDPEGKEFLDFATALNISAGGILLATRRSLPPSSKVSLQIPVAPVPPAANAPDSVQNMDATLVRAEHGESCHFLGLKFHRALRRTGKR